MGSSNTKQNQFFRFVRAMGVDIIIKAGECDKFQSMVGALGIGDRVSVCCGDVRQVRRASERASVCVYVWVCVCRRASERVRRAEQSFIVVSVFGGLEIFDTAWPFHSSIDRLTCPKARFSPCTCSRRPSWR